ncbi:unnamed protein product [marine sediment metagenome]|uniref:D-aminoacyl-tRNA deacylase n=1 Tax=marine sediment metagenome TaxID=412755 RepID=X1LMH8_9ZZZZ
MDSKLDILLMAGKKNNSEPVRILSRAIELSTKDTIEKFLKIKEKEKTIDKIVGEIGKGLVILLGVGEKDTEKDIKYLVNKIANLRIFEDEKGKFNLSLLDIEGEALVVSQFTLYADVRKGRRPSFTKAASPQEADALIEMFINELKSHGIKTSKGKFRAKMLVKIFNDGPVTIFLDSSEKINK